jgi:hypothetical protein
MLYGIGASGIACGPGHFENTFQPALYSLVHMHKGAVSLVVLLFPSCCCSSSSFSSMPPALLRRGQTSKGRRERTRSHAGGQALAAEARRHRNTTQYEYHGRLDRHPAA